MISAWNLLKITTIVITFKLLTNNIPKVESNSTATDKTQCIKSIIKNCEILKENDNKDADCCEHGYCCKNTEKNNSYVCDNEEICCLESLHCFRPKNENRRGYTLGELSWVFSVVPLVIIIIFFIVRAFMLRRWKNRQRIELQNQNNGEAMISTNNQENHWSTNYNGY